MGAYLTTGPTYPLLIPTQITRLTPGRVATNLGLAASAGAAVSLIAFFVFGTLSDRTVSRSGRRRPWIVGGTFTSVAGLLWLASAASLGTLLAAWILVEVGASATLAASLALLADAIPEHRRGMVCALVSIAYPVAISSVRSPSGG